MASREQRPDPDGFARVMRSLASKTPEELVLLAASAELAIAESVVLEENFIAGLDDEGIDRLIRDLDQDESGLTDT